MPKGAGSSQIAHLPSRGSIRGRAKAFAFQPELIVLEEAAASHPQTIRILNTLPDVPVDLVEDARHLKRPTEIADAKRRLILTTRGGQLFRGNSSEQGPETCCGARTLSLVQGCPMDCSGCPVAGMKGLAGITVNVHLEKVMAQVSAFLRRESSRFFRVHAGAGGDALALDPILDVARVLIPFFGMQRNAILTLSTKTAMVDHILSLRHRNRTVIAWPMLPESMIACEEQGTASLAERLQAAQRVASAGFGVGFMIDPIVMHGGVEETVEYYAPLIDQLLDAVPVRQISWIGFNMFSCDRTLPESSRARFPKTRLFSGEMVPVGKTLRVPRFLREQVLGGLWNRASAKIPTHKLFLCNETLEVWSRIDPSIRSQACLEKRLTNTEVVSFGF